MTFGEQGLAECWHKIGRAQIHLQALTTKIDAFLKAKPYAVVQEYDSEHAKYVFKLKIVKAIPQIELGLMIGDCVHNLRTALDYIAWRLAGSDLADRASFFPIHICLDHFNGGLYRLKRIHKDAISEIRGLQPYTTSKPEADMLWLLQELDARDKHKLITVTQTTAYGMRFTVDEFTDRYGDIRIHRGVGLDDGAMVAEISVPKGSPQSKVEVEGFAFDMKIEGGIDIFKRYPVGMVLAQIKSRVEEVITRFERLITDHPDWIP
jgi:hypothetical protein